MEQTALPHHPDAESEFRHLQQTCDVIDRETAEVEALTGAKAGVCMDVQMKEDPDQQEQVTIQLFQAQLDRLRQLSLAAGQAYFARLDYIPVNRPPERRCSLQEFQIRLWRIPSVSSLDCQAIR